MGGQASCRRNVTKRFQFKQGNRLAKKSGLQAKKEPRVLLEAA